MNITKRMEFIQRNSVYGMMINSKGETTMSHIELNKKVQPKPNKTELEEVHSIRGAYQLPCGTCVYSAYCAKMGYNKQNFYERIDAQ